MVELDEDAMGGGVVISIFTDVYKGPQVKLYSLDQVGNIKVCNH